VKKKKQTGTKPAILGQTKSIISSLNRAIITGEQAATAIALDELIMRYPNWTIVIAHLESFSDLNNPKIDPEAIKERCTVLLEAAHSLNRSKPFPKHKLQWIETLLVLTMRSAAGFKRLGQLLKRLTFFSDSLSTQTFRLAVLLEHHSRQANRLAIERGAIGAGYNPYAVLDDYLPISASGSTSILSSYEGVVEAVELVLRYSHFSISQDLRKAPLMAKDPFLDPDLERTIRAANIKNIINENISMVRYGGWSTHALSFDHACYAPSDTNEYIRYRVGDIREQAISIKFFGDVLDPAYLSEQHQYLLAISRKMEYPLPGQTWNGQYPSELGILIKNDKTFSLSTEAWISFRHYKPFVQALRIDDGRIHWKHWLNARNALSILAKLFSNALTPPGQESKDDDWRKYVILANKNDLVKIVQETGMAKQEAESAVNSMVFDQRRNKLELWDQPLLPISENRIVFVPSLIEAADPTRVLENAIAQWTPSSITARGIPFETDILNDVRTLGYGFVQKSVKIIDSDNKTVEYDLIWWWDDHLFLIETKCLQSIHGFADYARAKANIEEGIEQLRRRKSATKAHWNQLRIAAPDLQLPVECPPDSRITGIVLTNVTCFTTWVTSDGLIVADDVCFRRYFQDPSIDVYGQSTTGEEFVTNLGTIRDVPPSPENFTSYLYAPPQCNIVRERLEAIMIQSPATETEYPAWYLSLEYHPDLQDWVPKS
jgi:hypothetical protein